MFFVEVDENFRFCTRPRASLTLGGAGFDELSLVSQQLAVNYVNRNTLPVKAMVQNLTILIFQLLRRFDFLLICFFFLSFFILQNVLGHWEWRTGQFPITPSQPHLRYVRVNVNKFHLISFREDTFFFYLSSFHFISCVMFFGPIILWNIQTLNSKLGSICFDTLK